jgi:rhodanese-related sulfurtransferase
MQETPIIDVTTLEDWLQTGKEVTVLDIRSRDQREDWQIPGSIYLDAYKRLHDGDFSVMDEYRFRKMFLLLRYAQQARPARLPPGSCGRKELKHTL